MVKVKVCVSRTNAKRTKCLPKLRETKNFACDNTRKEESYFSNYAKRRIFLRMVREKKKNASQNTPKEEISNFLSFARKS